MSSVQFKDMENAIRDAAVGFNAAVGCVVAGSVVLFLANLNMETLLQSIERCH